MQVNPYLSFEGQCEAAFTFYARGPGGQLGTIFRYAERHSRTGAGDWHDKVMHGA
jgi:PhnB protein